MFDEEIQKEPFVFRPCGKYEITLRQLFDLVHASTEILQISIVSDYLASQDMPKGAKIIPNVLSNNVFGKAIYRTGNRDSEEAKRILKYYGDCPCWNLVSRIHSTCGIGVVPVLEVHVHFRDIRASFIQERKDIQKANRKRRKND